MCPVDMPSERKKGVMSMELFRKVIDDLAPYADRIEKVDLWGIGEPLLDQKLFEKIVYAKSRGFGGIAIATNADLLNESRQDALLESGIDTIIFSIDGTEAKTHETIRVGVTFDKVNGNAESLLIKRNAGNYPTKCVFRFIRQDENRQEWATFQEYWNKRISPERGDVIIGYDAHNWGGELISLTEKRVRDPIMDAKPCHHVVDRLMVLWDGTVPLCCSDMHHATYSYGNVATTDALTVFNNTMITKIRRLHDAGKKNSMKICSDCTILYSEAQQEVLQQAAS